MTKTSYCKSCSKKFKYDDGRQIGKWCSHKCQMEGQYKLYIEQWKAGKKDGMRGKYDVSKYIRKYLFRKNNASCSVCKWNRRHSVTGKVPLHIDHIDGNVRNNTEDNLRLLCPNCHSLTENFGVLNRGNGRYNCTKTKHPQYKYKGKQE